MVECFIIFTILNELEFSKDINKKIDLNPIIVNYENNLSFDEAKNFLNFTIEYNIVNPELEFNSLKIYVVN